jgi:hypothetical protein
LICPDTAQAAKDNRLCFTAKAAELVSFMRIPGGAGMRGNHSFSVFIRKTQPDE